jgi:hypothetical protein
MTMGELIDKNIVEAKETEDGNQEITLWIVDKNLKARLCLKVKIFI